MQELSKKAQQLQKKSGEAFWLNDTVYSYDETPRKFMSWSYLEYYFPSCVVRPFFKFDTEAMGNRDATPFAHTITQFVQKEMNTTAVHNIRYDNKDVYIVVSEIPYVLLDLFHFKIFWTKLKKQGLAQHGIWPFMEDFTKCPIKVPTQYNCFELFTVFHACDFYTKMRYYISSPIGGPLQLTLHEELPNAILNDARSVWQKLLDRTLKNSDMIRITTHFQLEGQQEQQMQKQFQLPNFITISSVVCNHFKIEIHSNGAVYKSGVLRFGVNAQSANIAQYVNTVQPLVNTICTLLWSKDNVLKYIKHWNVVQQNTICQYDIVRKTNWRYTKTTLDKEEFAKQEVHYCEICPTTQTVICKNAVNEFLALYESSALEINT